MATSGRANLSVNQTTSKEGSSHVYYPILILDEKNAPPTVYTVYTNRKCKV